MSEEQILAVETAPEQEVTATLEPEVSVPEEQPTEQPEQPEKRFTQEELDAAIGKRLAREQRKWEREQAARQQQQPTTVDVPSADYFDSPEAYAEALAVRKAEEMLAKREAAKQQSEIVEAYHDREEDARNKYDDFEQVAYNPRIPITEVMAQTIQLSDVGPDIAYYLGSNPKEAERISRLSPLVQAKEIGKIETRLSDNPPVKKTTTAPAPIAPVTPRGSGSPAYDTTDPRSIKTMSASEWIEADRQRLIKKWESQRNR